MKTKHHHRILFFFILFPFLIQAQINFHEYFENPVMKGTPNYWDSYSILTSSVVYDGEKYHMYYTAKDFPKDDIFNMDIGYASSEDGYIWKKDFNEPIFKHDTLGWERDGYISPIVLKMDDNWHMWYYVLSKAFLEGEEENIASEYPLGYATSKDGINWERYGEERYGEPLEFKVSDEGWDSEFVGPSDVIYDGSKFLMYYTGRDSLGNSAIGVAVSDNGIHWKKDTYNNPVIVGNGEGTFNKYVYNCTVTFEENNPEYAYEMWYIGFSENSKDKIFYAKSKDGKNWLKEEKPILSCEKSLWSRHYYEDVEVIKVGKKYQLWVNGLGESYIKNASFGYFEDFGSCMHCDNVVCNTKYNSNKTPPEEFMATLCNRDCENFQVWARIECDETKHSELYRMIPSGQSKAEYIIEEPVRCNTEGFFTFSVFLKNTETNKVIFDSRNFNMIDKYTTAGPVKITDYEISQVSDITQLRISNVEIINSSLAKTIPNISVKFTSPDTCVRNITSAKLFGDLPAQGTKVKIGHYYVYIDTLKDYAFIAEISSNNVVYWKDTINFVYNPVGVELAENLPTEYSLLQNYPNPFNPSTTIKYQIPQASVILSGAKNLKDFSSQSSPNNGAPQNDYVNVALQVYDILGREVATLINQKQKPGNYEVEWNSSEFSSGIYFYKLSVGTPFGSANSYVQTKKMILLR